MKKKSTSAMNMLKAAFKKMPWRLRVQVFFKMLKAGSDAQKRMAVMKEINKRRHFTIPREQIPWHPTIDKSKCVGCDVCTNFCPRGVYEKPVQNTQPTVAHPAKCVFLCSGCEPKCPKAAISFPEKKDFVKYIYYQ